MERIDEAYISSHFSEAVEKGFIQSFYQPIYRSVTGKMIGAETLARWRDPERGMLSPADFVPALERSGLIFDLDMEMLRQSCVFYHALQERGTPLYSITINLSRHDFRHAELFDTVVGIIDAHGVPRDVIKLEITESLMLEDIETFQRLFRQFSEAGFSIWIDDFGSGYSSLNVLQNYSFDVLKFDMLFLRNFSAKGRQLLASLINMAKSLGIQTLTEGIETQEQRDFLLAAGCEAQQGFFFSKPLSKEDLIALIDAQGSLPETREDKAYWNKIGRLNFLSANPLDDYASLENPDAAAEFHPASTGVPLALMECSWTESRYVYASGSYLKCIRDLGFDSADALGKAINDRRSEQYLIITKMITDAIGLGGVQTVEYFSKDVYYRLSAKCLARREGKSMIALQLSTFDSEREVKTAQEMLNYGNSLFSTYELVVLIYPDSNLSTRIYTTESLPTYDREGSLHKSVEKFASTEVDPRDQARYLRFVDFDTLTQRIEANPKRFIQGFFRMCWSNKAGNWYTARVSQIHSSAERAYLLTVQALQGTETQWLDMIASEHPELLG